MTTARPTNARADLTSSMSDESLTQVIERTRAILRDPALIAAHSRAEVLFYAARSEQKRRAGK